MKMSKRVIIIGFSFAGKLAARVLSEFFQEVWVFERDPLSEKPMPRKGIPQSHQPHVLLKKGERLLTGFFPNVTEDLLQQGAVAFDFLKDVHWVHHGLQKVRVGREFAQISLSRPLLEWVVQRRLEKIPNLKVYYETEVRGLIFGEANDVKGVRVSSESGKELEEVPADLVVDCSGAASFFMRALREGKQVVPTEETLSINLAYTSRKVRLPQGYKRDWQAFLLYPDPPALEKGGIIYPLENEEWIISLFGYGGHHCVTKEEAFLTFAESLSSPVLAETIRQANALSELKTYKVLKQVRRRMDKLRAPTEGLLVMGDAFCRFDPVFGQGMTAACLEAHVLQQMARTARHKIGSPRFNQRLYKKFMRKLFPLWLMVLAEDFRYTKTKGTKPFGLRVLQKYMSKLYQASETDPIVYERFAKVLHLLDSPFVLFSPSILWRVLIKATRHREM